MSQRPRLPSIEAPDAVRRLIGRLFFGTAAITGTRAPAALRRSARVAS